MVIGLLLLGGLITLMVNSKKNYAQQDYNARLQENARFAMQFLSYDIRMAGYFGCSNNIINDSTIAGISASEGGGDADSVTITYGEPYEAGSEALIDADNYQPYAAPLTLVLTQVPSDWDDSDTLVIADCGSAAVADIGTDGIDAPNNQVTVTTGTGDLGRVFDSESSDGGPIVVRRLFNNSYTIEPTGQSGIPVLMRNGLELVEGVENIQLLYQAIAGDTFVDGSGAPGDPAAVKLGVLLRSVSNENLNNREFGSGADLTLDDGQHTVLDQDLEVGELRGTRRVFTTTLAVRNH